MLTVPWIAGLRDYQQECLSASAFAFARGVWSQVVVLPTGSGKTVVFAHLLQAYRGWLAQFPALQQKVLILAHRDELLAQAADKVARYNPELRVGLEAAAQRTRAMDDVVVASVQTLTAKGGRRLGALDPDQFRIVVVDEAHHAPSASYQQVLRAFGLVPPAALWQVKRERDVPAARTRVREWWQAEWPNRLLVGVTATPARSDALGLEWTFRELVYERSLRWMIEREYLAPLTGYVVETGLSLDAVRQTAGDFNQGQLAEVVNTPARNRQAVEAWLEVARGRPTLAFTVDVQHAVDLARTFRAAGVAAEAVSGNDRERAEKLAEYGRGQLDVLTNCNLLTEGFDSPRTACVLHCRPTQSAGLYMQMTGRGTRLAPGKSDCLVLDVVDVARKHSLMTAGDLFGLPRRFNAKGRDLRGVALTIEAARQEFPDAQFVDGLDPESLQRALTKLDLWTVRESETAARYTRLQWVEDSPERFHVTLPARSENGALLGASQETQGPGQQRVDVRQTMLGGWEVSVATGTQIDALGALDALPEAFARAERWVEANRPDTWRMKQRDARWRDKPASRSQLALLAKLKAPQSEGLTRGQASDLLDRFFSRKGRRTA